MIISYIKYIFKIIVNIIVWFIRTIVSIVSLGIYMIVFSYYLIVDIVTFLFIPKKYRVQYKDSSEGEIHSISPKHIVDKRNRRSYSKKHNLNNPRFVLISKQNTDGTVEVSSITSQKPILKYRRLYTKITNVKMRLSPSYIDYRSNVKSSETSKRFNNKDFKKPLDKVSFWTWYRHRKSNERNIKRK